MLQFTVSMLFEHIAPILVAALVGGLIGIEREYRDKSAGFRTMILIAIGSTLFTLLSKEMATDSADATRIAAAVVSGIGFLGAGVILKDGITVRGLTTASAIWVVSSLGMAAAAEKYDLVLTVTALSLFVLWFLPPFERWIDKLYEFLEFHITIKNTEKAEAKIMEILQQEKVRIVQIRHTRIVKGEKILHIKVKCSLSTYSRLSAVFVAEKTVIAFAD